MNVNFLSIHPNMSGWNDFIEICTYYNGTGGDFPEKFFQLKYDLIVENVQHWSHMVVPYIRAAVFDWLDINRRIGLCKILRIF